MQNVIGMVKAISDEGRLRIILALGEGELCICQIIDFLGLAPSTVSKHLTILKQAGLIQSRKDGKWIYVRLNEENTMKFREHLLKSLFSELRNDPRMLEDRKMLKKIEKKDLMELCKNRGNL